MLTSKDTLLIRVAFTMSNQVKANLGTAFSASFRGTHNDETGQKKEAPAHGDICVGHGDEIGSQIWILGCV
jgi:hypothetical protein